MDFIKLKVFVLIGVIASFLFAACDGGIGGDDSDSGPKFSDPVFTATYKEAGKDYYTVYVDIEDRSSEKSETQPIKHNFFVRGGTSKLSSGLLYKDVSARIVAKNDSTKYPIIRYKITADSYHVGVQSQDPNGNTSKLVWKQAEKITMKGNGFSSDKIKITNMPPEIAFCEIWLSNSTTLYFDNFQASGSNTVSSDNTVTITLYNYDTENWNSPPTDTQGYYLFIEYNGIQQLAKDRIKISAGTTTLVWDESKFISTRFDF